MGGHPPRRASSPLSLHASATEAERHAHREQRAGERIIVRDRYGRERTSSPGASRR